MTFVVDTSVAIKWFVSEPDTGRAEWLLEPDREHAAPDLLIAEVGNVLWRRERNGDIDGDQVDLALRRLPDFFEHISPSSELVPAALDIAREIRHSVYDCMYLAQAAALRDACMVTVDDRFVAKASSGRHAGLLRPLSGLSPARDL